MNSASGTVAKRHHYLPQFLLRGFAEGGIITTVELPGTRVYNQPVRKAASENHLYSLPGHPNGVDSFEKALSQLEGEAASVLAEIAAGSWPLAEESRSTLAYFIALQMARGPEQQRNMRNLRAQIARMEIGYGGRGGVKRWVKKNTGLDIDDDAAEIVWDQAMSPDGPPIRVSAQQFINHAVKMADSFERYMSGRPWSLVHFDRRSLILSDVPVGLIRQPDHDNWSGVGLLTAWGITFPLTRKLGLLMSDPTELFERVPVENVRAGAFDFEQVGSTALEKMFNETSASQASMRLYHHPSDARFVPPDLNEPSPVTLSLRGVPDVFTGEP